jgi:4-hydroxythreonine-4-phosphate dehydrogenase
MSSSAPRPASKRPRLAITVGDVAGVGPEIALKIAASLDVTSRCQPILLGPAKVLRRIAETLGLPVPAAATLETLDQHENAAALLIDCGRVDVESLVPGHFSAETGRASFQAVEWAIEQTVSGTCAAMVTGPIQKEAWHLADTGFLGHTELLADRTGTEQFSMMLSGKSCSTVLASIHLPLADAVASLSVARVAQAISHGGLAMERRHRRPPRITVLGLNPHAGEHGLLSRGEEENVIVPAMEEIQSWSDVHRRDWQLTGPVPPDAAFTPAMRQRTDVHICMYHDQGLIPLKALSFDDGVNVTLGLPIVRTSPDHGTAMDLAWKGTASTSSMRAAIDMAIDLSR